MCASHSDLEDKLQEKLRVVYEDLIRKVEEQQKYVNKNIIDNREQIQKYEPKVNKMLLQGDLKETHEKTK